MEKSRSFWMYLSMGMLMGTLLIGCAEMQMPEAGGASAGPSSSTGSKAAPVVDVAAGTQGDSLAACLGRIPSNASPGQRQLAELSCQRDERARQPITAVPGK